MANTTDATNTIATTIIATTGNLRSVAPPSHAQSKLHNFFFSEVLVFDLGNGKFINLESLAQLLYQHSFTTA